MLRVSGLRDRRGGYYLADLAPELGRQSIGPTSPGIGRWSGQGAARLGLRGPVSGPSLGQLLEGRHPVTGAQLVVGRRVVGGRFPVTAYDLTFAAPKSVSVLWGTAGPEVARQVVAGHHEAVAEAVDYVARRAVSVRRRSGEDRMVLAAEGMVAATFTHGVNRALEPHLHSHVVVMNLAQGIDGRWTALDSRALYAHSTAAGQLYDAALRHQLHRRLGVEWVMRDQGHREIAGITAEALGAFSSRRAEIEQHRAQVGRAAPSHGSRVAWAVTRDQKVVVADPDDLRRRWSTRAVQVELSPTQLEQVCHRPKADRAVGPPEEATLDEYRFAGALLGSDGGAARRDVVAAWAGALDYGGSAPDVERCVDALADWGPGVGVAEPHRALGGLVPSTHRLVALGPRPTSPTRLALWQATAADIDRYRARWDVNDGRRPLGTNGSSSELAALPGRQLADYLAVARGVAETRRRLGRDLERAIDARGRDLGGGDPYR